ncbi:hypothetical protein BN439_3780 [Erwinia amylovora Ea644]|nr:hypothetical protein BN439_3780 [Erwinia amylovora Ea644]
MYQRLLSINYRHAAALPGRNTLSGIAEKIFATQQQYSVTACGGLNLMCLPRCQLMSLTGLKARAGDECQI